jgi:hypothetical protein
VFRRPIFLLGLFREPRLGPLGLPSVDLFVWIWARFWFVRLDDSPLYSASLLHILLVLPDGGGTRYSLLPC